MSELGQRAEHLLLLVAYSIISLGFLGLIVIATIWLTRLGYGLVADVLVLNYIVVSTPIFLAQIAIVFDLLLTVIGEASVVVPVLRVVSDRASAGPVTRTLATALSTVSLFSSVSTWALGLVLPPATARELARMKYRTETGIFAALLARIKTGA